MAGQVTGPSLYDSDFCRWTSVMADRLRNRDAGSLDWENLAEEIEDVGKSLSRELRSRFKVLIAHLLKWQFQPELREGSTWLGTIVEQRIDIIDLLEESPSLQAKVSDVWAKFYRDAVRIVAAEMRVDKRTLPVSCPYTQQQVLDDDFLPD